ncbi:3958_t:CDS:2, partial [Gigaspora rosea]
EESAPATSMRKSTKLLTTTTIVIPSNNKKPNKRNTKMTKESAPAQCEKVLNYLPPLQ